MTSVTLVFFSLLPFLAWFFYCLIHKHAVMMHLPGFFCAALIAAAFSVAARFALEPCAVFFAPAVLPLFTALVVTAIPEEATKLLAVIPFSRNAPGHSPLPRRTILARAVCISLAFSSLENIFFAAQFPGSLPLRFGTAVPLHASLAVFSACWLSGRLNRDRYHSAFRGRFAPGFFMLAAAICLHALYALGFELRPIFAGLSVVTAAVAFIGAMVLWNTCGDDDEQRS